MSELQNISFLLLPRGREDMINPEGLYSQLDFLRQLLSPHSFAVNLLIV
jgi:hypothetical protein